MGKHDDRTIRDSLGIYTGQLDSLKRPSGYGRRWGHQGEYYEGHFEAGLPDGFGFYIAPRQYLQAGEWRKGVFKGEKLTYNKERIYGIDVSRHQHERDGKCYPIDWDRLRITHLGTLSDKPVRGKVDYPVSFAYVKSTEGCTVFNAYYEDDYRDARKGGRPSILGAISAQTFGKTPPISTTVKGLSITTSEDSAGNLSELSTR